MKQLLLALAIGLTAMGCNRYGQEEDNVTNEDIYEGVLYNSGFCGDIFRVVKINNKEVSDNEWKTIKLINLPENIQGIDRSADMKVIISDLEDVGYVRCGGFLGYNYKAQVKNIITIEKR